MVAGSSLPPSWGLAAGPLGPQGTGPLSLPPVGGQAQAVLKAPEVRRATISEVSTMDWDEAGHMDEGWGIAMMLIMLGFWAMLTVAIGFAIVWILRSTRSTWASPPATGPTPATGRPAASSAEQILAERLARGEIDPEEYRARMEALNSSIRD
jgi:putative membrane protein